jgi:hypothetical protein
VRGSAAVVVASAGATVDGVGVIAAAAVAAAGGVADGAVDVAAGVAESVLVGFFGGAALAVVFSGPAGLGSVRVVCVGVVGAGQPVRVESGCVGSRWCSGDVVEAGIVEAAVVVAEAAVVVVRSDAVLLCKVAV